MNKKKVEKLLLGLLVLAAIGTSQAAEIELGIGETQFSKQINGIWWQSPYANQFDLRHSSYSVGMNWQPYEHLRVRTGYLNLGGVESSALATASDADYATQACNGPCWPMSHWYGSSSVDGEYLTLDPSVNVGPVKLFAEVGKYYYLTKFTMTIPDWRSCQSCAPQYVQVHGDGAHQFGDILGFGFEYKKVQFVLTHYNLVGGSVFPPNFSSRTYNASFRYSF